MVGRNLIVIILLVELAYFDQISSKTRQNLTKQSITISYLLITSFIINIKEYMKETCGICGFGDGLWREDDRKVLNTSLPPCEKCKADGWINDPTEVQKAILEDPLLKNVVEHQSPYI